MSIVVAATVIGIAIVIAALAHGRFVRAEAVSDATAGRDSDGVLERRLEQLELERERLGQERLEHTRALERLAGLTSAQAKGALLREIEEEARHEASRLVREIEEQARREGQRRARSILAVAMQRLSAGSASEVSVSIVQLAADDLKGRIIGREGRNIRTLESLTGVDVIIDEAPGVVVLSSFDAMRREVARMTLERLLADGRIHPASIEEAVERSRAELDRIVQEAGERAALEAGVQGLDPEIVRLLGRLRFRTSYGQNVLAHSIECAHLCGLMADELGADVRTARRAALLHDIGKAVTHEVEGPHALVGGRIARRHGEPEAVAHAMEAHHNEVELQTVEAVLVQTADSLSGSRPGARGETLTSYVKRLSELERIATRHSGVEKAYALQAGREIRVIVTPGAVDDQRAGRIAREIAREIETELEYPGQIKVTVIRESRATEYAR